MREHPTSLLADESLQSHSHHVLYSTVIWSLLHCVLYSIVIWSHLHCVLYSTRGEGGLRPPSPLVRVAGATLISREEGVSREFIELSI